MKLTIRDVAHLLQVSPDKVAKWIKEDSFPAYRIKERYRFNRIDVLEWATAKKIPFRPELVHDPEAAKSSLALSPISLHAALEAGGIHYNVPNHDKVSVMHAVVARIPLPTDVDREFATEVLLAREDLGSTAIGDGFAIPHTRNPIVFHVERPLLTLCFLERPVDFKAVDGVPVHTLFALVCPMVSGHLTLLSRLAYSLKDDPFQKLLKARAPREELMAHVQKLESKMPGAFTGKKET